MANNLLTDRMSKKEDLAILEFILKDNRLYFSGGLSIWKKAVDEGICPGRGFWSLKERFMKTICKNLQNYNLPIETRHKMLNYIKASPAEKKRLRMDYGDEQDFKYIHQSSCKASTADEERLTNYEKKFIQEVYVEESNENNSLTDQPEPEFESKPTLKSPIKHLEDQRNHVEDITFENDPKTLVLPQDCGNNSENLAVVTDSKCNLFNDIISVDKSTVLNDHEIEGESFQQPEKCLDKHEPKPKPKPKSKPSKTKKANTLPVRRELRVAVRRLKNL